MSQFKGRNTLLQLALLFAIVGSVWADDELPLSVKNYQYLPTVRSQQLGDCGAFAPSYYYKTYQEAREHGWIRPDPDTHPERVMSPGFTFPLTGMGRNDGASLQVVMELMVTHGIATWRDMPETSDYLTWPTEEVFRQATKYRAQSVASIDTSSDAGIAQLKRHLAGGDLAVFSMLIYLDFKDSYPDNLWTDSGVVFGNSGVSEQVFHALTVIGYDDNKSYNDGTGIKTGAFLAVNSWGQGWGVTDPDIGTGGFVWLSYDYFKEHVGETLTMEDRIGYQPHTFLIYGVTHPARRDLSVRIYGGGGVLDHSWAIEAFPIHGGTVPFSGRVVVDISDHTTGTDPNYWLRVRDLQSPEPYSPYLGQIAYAAIERSDGSRLVMQDLPKATIGYQPGVVGTLLDLPLGTLNEAAVLPAGTGYGLGAAVAWGDYDKDGDFDFAICGSYQEDPTYLSESTTHIFRNDDGVFVDSGIELQGVSKCALAWGDINNDGFLDLALCGIGDDGLSRTEIYRNLTGEGFYSGSFALPPLRDCALTFGDYDRDGLVDLALSGNNEGSLYAAVYRNELGSFSIAGSDLNASGSSTSPVIWADLDNDGYPDLLHGDRLFRNLGDGSFEGSSPFSLGSLYPNAASVVDIDYDGYLDVVLSGHDSSVSEQGGTATRVFRNAGNGVFSTISGTGILGIMEGTHAWGDINNDGLFDLALNGYYLSHGQSVSYARVFYRDSTHVQFQNSGFPIADLSRGGAAWAPYGASGDLALLATGDEKPETSTRTTRFYANRYSEISESAPPLPPTSLWSQPGAGVGSVVLFWTAASDAETPPGGLLYNLRVGTKPGFSDVVSPAYGTPLFGNLTSGRVSSSQGGTILKSLPPGDYYFSVQSIDAGLQVSTWSYESSFIIPGMLVGDPNGDRRGNSADIIYLANYLYGDGSAPIGSGDANGDGAVSKNDVEYLANYYYANGPQPKH